MKLLLAAGASVHGSVWTRTGVTALLRACAAGHAQCVLQHVDAHAPVNTPSATGETPLHSASMKGHADVVTILLAAGADPSATAAVEGRPLTALQCAELKKHDECAQLLLRRINERPGGGGGSSTALASPGSVGGDGDDE